jgi:hypothetical protein
MLQTKDVFGQPEEQHFGQSSQFVARCQSFGVTAHHHTSPLPNDCPHATHRRWITAKKELIQFLRKSQKNKKIPLERDG